MLQEWLQYKKEKHSYVDFCNFIKQHEENLAVLPMIYADILYNQVKVLLQECNSQENYIESLKILKSYLRLYISHQGIDNFPLYAFSFRACTKYAFDDLKNGTCSLVHPSYFNDPIDPLLINWLNLKIEKNPTNQLYPLLLKSTHYIRMRCFAMAKDDDVKNLNPLMWAHYADSHKGFCVKYRINSDVFQNTDTSSLSLHSVEYKILKSINQIELRDALFSKQKIWKYEKELRFIAYDLNLCNVSDVKLVKGLQIDSLYIGCKCSEVNINSIIDIFSDSVIPIYKMVVDVKNPMKYSHIRIV